MESLFNIEVSYNKDKIFFIRITETEEDSKSSKEIRLFKKTSDVNELKNILDTFLNKYAKQVRTEAISTTQEI